MRRLIVAACGLVAALAVTTALRAQQPPANPDGWQIPQTAPTEVNPIAPGPEVIAKGKKLYQAKCERCHGPLGQGNGPDADPEHMPDDLSDGKRAVRNPDGVMFYKVWNGRKKPKMPAFKSDMAKNDVWTLIHYVKTLRK